MSSSSPRSWRSRSRSCVSPRGSRGLDHVAIVGYAALVGARLRSSPRPIMGFSRWGPVRASARRPLAVVGCGGERHARLAAAGCLRPGVRAVVRIGGRPSRARRSPRSTPPRSRPGPAFRWLSAGLVASTAASAARSSCSRLPSGGSLGRVPRRPMRFRSAASRCPSYGSDSCWTRRCPKPSRDRRQKQPRRRWGPVSVHRVGLSPRRRLGAGTRRLGYRRADRARRRGASRAPATGRWLLVAASALALALVSVRHGLRRGR